MKKRAIYLSPCQLLESPTLELRANLNNALLGLASLEGVYYWDRRSNLHYILSWDELLALRTEMAETLDKKLVE